MAILSQSSRSHQTDHLGVRLQVLRRTTFLPSSNSATHPNRRILSFTKSRRLRDPRLDLPRRVPTLARTVRNRQRNRTESSFPLGLPRREFGDQTCVRKVLECRHYEWNVESVGYVSEDAWVRGDGARVLRDDFDEGLFLTSRAWRGIRGTAL